MSESRGRNGDCARRRQAKTYKSSHKCSLWLAEKAYTLGVMAVRTAPTTSAAPRGWGAGTSAIVRQLVAAREPVSGSAVARLVGVTQPRASQVLATLLTLGAVDAREDGYVGRRARLLDLYAERSRPQLAAPEDAWYSTRALEEQARTVVRIAKAARTRVAFSADLGPDLLVPWRHPTLAVAYASSRLDFEAAHFVPAEGRADATLLVRWTGDATLLDPAGDWPNDADGLPLADPVQQWRDLLDLGGADRGEAAARLRRAILDRSIGRRR